MVSNNTGFLVQITVRQSEGKGLGVFAGEPVRKGSIVWRHKPGVFAVYDERTFDEKIQTMSFADIVFELTHVHAFGEFPGCLIRALDDGILINHSSDPNLATNKSSVADTSMNVESPDYLQNVARALRDDRYSLVAIRDIEAGEELVNDYNDDDDGPAFYDTLCEQYGVTEDFLNDR